jgi:uncharacterized phage protein (TIGR01671 family)
VRTIKFRAWYKNEERFVDLRDIDSVGEVVQQYTGLKDKHGAAVYEGDILRLSFRDLDIVKSFYRDSKDTLLPIILDKIVNCVYVGTVQYDSTEGILGQFTYFVGDISFANLKSLVSESGIEIIGNIYKNKKESNE